MSASFDSDTTSRISNSFSFDPSQMGNNFAGLYTDFEESQAEDEINTPEEQDVPLDFELLAEAIGAETNTTGNPNQGPDLNTEFDGLQLGNENDHNHPPTTPQSGSRSTTPTHTEATADDENPRAFGTISPEPSPSRVCRARVPECLDSMQEEFLHIYHQIEWRNIFGLSRKLNRCACDGRNVEDVREEFIWLFERYRMKDVQRQWFATWVFGPRPIKAH
jgi:hypothetical protein